MQEVCGEILKPDVFTENPVRANFSAEFEKTLCFDGKNLMQISDKNFQFYRYQLSFQILNIGISDFFIIITMKGLDTVDSLSAGEARDSNRNMGTLIIIYIFVTFTHSNTDFHKLLMRISGTLHSSLSCCILTFHIFSHFENERILKMNQPFKKEDSEKWKVINHIFSHFENERITFFHILKTNASHFFTFWKQTTNAFLVKKI